MSDERGPTYNPLSLDAFTDPVPNFQADDEQFCDDCLAGLESSEHFYECVVPAREAMEQES